jgi:hypothetical protein
VFLNQRIHAHKVFAGLAARGKTSTGWFFGLKLHLVVNDRGEILQFCITPGNDYYSPTCSHRALDRLRRALATVNKAGINSPPCYSRPFVQRPGLEILDQQLEQLHQLRVGQRVHVDGGQPVQELPAFGPAVGIMRGNGKRLIRVMSRIGDGRVKLVKSAAPMIHW